MPKIDSWLRSVLWESTLPQVHSSEQVATPPPNQLQGDFEIHRLKGLLIFSDEPRTKIIQGVREVFEIVDGQMQRDMNREGRRTSKIVLIGRGLHGTGLDWQASLEAAVLGRC